MFGYCFDMLYLKAVAKQPSQFGSIYNLPSAAMSASKHSPEKDETTTDDDAASQTTEDDPQVPDRHEIPPPQPPPRQPAPAPTNGTTPSGRERPHYELRHTMRGHTSSISAVKFSPDGTLLASCSAFDLAPRNSPVY